MGIDQAKQAVRDKVWRLLDRENAVAKDSYGKIPAFDGAELGAELLARTPEWRQSRTVKANPDYAQLPVRVRALEDAKLVYMAVPKIAGERPFFRLDPDDMAISPQQAAEKSGAKQ